MKTPVSRKKKKIYKLENLTKGSSGKKSRLKLGERKFNNVNDIRRLWERKSDANCKENSRTPVKEKTQINCHKVKKNYC